MGHAAKAREQERKARARLRVLHHDKQVTRNVSRTSRVLRDFTDALLSLGGSSSSGESAGPSG
jgi:hypothetical protein